MRIANVEFKLSGIDLRPKIDDLAIKKNMWCLNDLNSHLRFFLIGQNTLRLICK